MRSNTYSAEADQAWATRGASEAERSMSVCVCKVGMLSRQACGKKWLKFLKPFQNVMA